MRRFRCGICKLMILKGLLIPANLSKLHCDYDIVANVTKIWKYVISKLFPIVFKHWYNEKD